MRAFLLVTALLAGLPIAGANGASLRVSPVLVDLSAPASASTLRIWNDAQRVINVQVRIFRWSQINGQDVYTPTRDVVVSPPMTQLRGGAENMIRVVRTSKAAILAEERYRVIVDELPQGVQRQTGTVSLVVRHSIPVFFSPGAISPPKPAWSIRRMRGGYEVNVTNTGGKRIRIANLQLLSGGTAIAKHNGLVGYVLGGSKATWFIPASGGKAGGSSLTIAADSDTGRVHATSSVKGG